MPARNEIFNEIIQAKNGAQDSVRRKYLKELHDYTGKDTIIYASAFSSKKLPSIPNFLINITLEDIQGFMSALYELKGKELDLIIHSPGGSLEAVDQIVEYLRSKYNSIRAIIPQNAMSAATMLACACDEIIMGKHSALGPIDPQITFPIQNGHFTAPAQSILEEFERAKEEVVKEPKVSILWINKMKDYPPGLLKMCLDTMQLAKEKVAEWLTNYMFKNEPNNEKISHEIAEWLGDANHHKTHGKPLNIAKLREKGLKVAELESDQKMQEKVMAVFHSASASLEITNCMKFIENHNGIGWFVNVNLKQ